LRNLKSGNFEFACSRILAFPFDVGFGLGDPISNRENGKMSKSPKNGKSLKGIVIPDYLSKLPDAIPPGRILVHNSVRPTKRLGHRGFSRLVDIP
jgi:hypothetical protein